MQIYRWLGRRALRPLTFWKQRYSTPLCADHAYPQRPPPLSSTTNSGHVRDDVRQHDFSWPFLSSLSLSAQPFACLELSTTQPYTATCAARATSATASIHDACCRIPYAGDSPSLFSLSSSPEIPRDHSSAVLFELAIDHSRPISSHLHPHFLGHRPSLGRCTHSLLQRPFNPLGTNASLQPRCLSPSWALPSSVQGFSFSAHRPP